MMLLQPNLESKSHNVTIVDGAICRILDILTMPCQRMWKCCSFI